MPPGISYSFAAGIKKGGKMKLRIFGEKQASEERFLMLDDRGDGSIALAVADENGIVIEQGYLLAIKSNGRIKLYSDVSKDLGFELNNEGRIEIEK